MSRADQVAQKIREAFDHPRAPLLFSIGAERPKPQSAASEAQALGLTVEEEKLAKWVGILKRDAENLFGKPFFEALQDIIKEGEQEMDIKRGSGFFEAKGNFLVRKLVVDLFKAGVKFFYLSEEQLPRLKDEHRVYFIGPYGFLTIGVKGSTALKYKEFYTNSVVLKKQYINLVSDEGFEDLVLRVRSKKALNATRKFARAWEAKSRQLKGSREATVTIIQDFG